MKNYGVVSFVLCLLTSFYGCQDIRNIYVAIPNTNSSICLEHDNDSGVNRAIITHNDFSASDTLSWKDVRGWRGYSGIFIYILENRKWIVLNDPVVDPKSTKHQGDYLQIDWREQDWSGDWFHANALDYYDIVLPVLEEGDLRFQSVIRLEKNRIWYKPDHKTLPYILYDRFDDLKSTPKRLRDKVTVNNLGLLYQLYADGCYTYLEVRNDSGIVLDKFKWLGTSHELTTSFVYQEGVYYIKARVSKQNDRHIPFMEHYGVSKVEYVPIRNWPDGLYAPMPFLKDTVSKNALKIFIYGHDIKVVF